MSFHLVHPSRRDLVLGTAATGFVVSLPAMLRSAEAITEAENLAAIFREAGVDGTFVACDAASGHLTAYSPERAQRRYVPASTFKVANSLIALETGAVKDADEVIPFGGKPQPFKTWEKDMSMREAVPASNVAIFQELARRIGFDAYSNWLAKLDYGNRQIGTALETFWLDGPLEISAVEQARFVARLARGAMPASERTQSLVRDILLLESGQDWKLYGKTGWRFSSTPQLGWWTGWVERRDAVTAFALNIDMPSVDDAKKRVTIGRRALQALGVLP